MYFQSLAPDRVLLRYRTFAHDVGCVWIALRGGEKTEMHIEQDGPLFSLWSAQVPLPISPALRGEVRATGSTPISFEYTFVLSDGARRVSDPNTYAGSISDADIFRTPEWAKHAIWYQIFPERFRDGDPSNDPTPTRPWTNEWFTPSDFEAQSGKTF